MPYQPVAHGKLDGLDYRVSRPFKDWQQPDLLEKIQEWVALSPPRLELATLAYEELRHRGENRAKAARRLFPEHLPPIPWLVAARQDVLAELESIDDAPRARTALCDPSFRLFRNERLLWRVCRCNQASGRRPLPSASHRYPGGQRSSRTRHGVALFALFLGQSGPGRQRHQAHT